MSQDGVQSYLRGIGNDVPIQIDQRNNQQQPIFSQKTSERQSAKKGTHERSKERKDRIHQIEQENNRLKGDRNLLEDQLKQMETKMQRIDKLMRSRNNINGEVPNYTAQDLEKDLQKEHDELVSEIEIRREKVRKLAVIQRGLASRPATAAKPGKYDHVQGKIQQNQGKGNQHYTQIAEELRKQLVTNEREIIKLQDQINKISSRGGGVDTSLGGPDRIRAEIQHMIQETRECNVEIENLEQKFESDKAIFAQSKNYTAEIQKQIREVSEKNENLKMENSRLEWQTKETQDLELEIDKITQEKDHLERTIRNITAEPFLRKEGQSMQLRMKELELKVQEKSKIVQSLKEEEIKKAEAANKAKKELNDLMGQKEYLAGQHKVASEEWKAKHGQKLLNTGPTTKEDLLLGLNTKDSKTFDSIKKDLKDGTISNQAPQWANLAFLDRFPPSAHTGDPKEILIDEIKALKEEKAGFAQELEKAQNLLKLQTDIEKENTLFFQQEIKRLSLIEKSSSAKLEELARRADEKEKMIQDIERKVKPDKDAASPARHGAYDDDVQSEFSAITNESEIRVDENILDFKVENAEFYQNVLSTIPSLKEASNIVFTNKALITLCTVDFYNHSTETTQMGEGIKPNYQTQFSFKNKVDDFYVAFLQKQPLKMDIYINKDNAAVHMGRCEIMLKQLIEREVHHIDSKTPLIQEFVRIYAIDNNNLEKVIGTIKYKMRLRKPIQESMRYFREKAEIQNMTRAAQLNIGTLKPPKRQISIQIIAGHQLKFQYSQIANVAPFFYYQFYTFDERYGSNSAGVNPRFDDSYSYEVTFDAKAIQYFETQNLEIILFDDNAPIAGQGPDAAVGDDMIGICKIPLKNIIAGCSSHEKYPIQGQGGQNQTVGQLEVKISVMDLERGQEQINHQDTELRYDKEWENELIRRIAKALAKFDIDVALMFGLFSRGTQTCTKEDFKYTLLARFNLRHEISERELDLFLLGNEILQHHDCIEQDDFVLVFEQEILHARNQIGNQEALENEFDRDLGQTRAHPSSKTLGQINFQKGSQDYNENKGLEIMGEAIKKEGADKIITEVNKRAAHGLINTHNLQETLKRAGQIEDVDGNRIANFLQYEGKIELQKLQQYMRRAKDFARNKSEAVKKLNNILARNGKSVIQRLESSDHNKDGNLNLEGFKAALLQPEYNIHKEELVEAFHLISNDSHGGLFYRQWVLENFPKYDSFFQHQQTSDRAQSVFTDPLPHEQSLRIGESITLDIDANKLVTAKNKFENYIRVNNLYMGALFGVMDKNSKQTVNFKQFNEVVRNQMHFDEEESKSLFREIDKNSDNNITYEQLIDYFKAINIYHQVSHLQQVIKGSNVNPEFTFNQHSKDQKNKLNTNEFTRLLRDLLSGNITSAEEYQVFKHFDKGNKGYVSKQDFLNIIEHDVREQQSNQSSGFGVEDIFKPLATRIKKEHSDVDQLFRGIDKNHNGRISSEEIKKLMFTKFQITLLDEEIRNIQQYFEARFKSKEISLDNFKTLVLKSSFEHKNDQQEAQKSLYDIKAKIQSQSSQGISQTIQNLIAGVKAERVDLITVRTFKLAVNSLKVLTQYKVDNLAKFLDRQNEGFISTADFIGQVTNAYNPEATKRSNTSNAGATVRSTINKW